MNGPAVTSLMRASGLTHGGFYKHFSSRDDLVVEAVQESLQELTDTLIHAAKQSGSNEGWRAMIKTYLSIERCDRPEIGCPIAALASDIARTPAAMKQQISAAILNFRANLIPFMPGKTEPEKSSNYLKIMTSMVGAIAIARTMLDRTVTAIDPRFSPRYIARELLADRLSAPLTAFLISGCPRCSSQLTVRHNIRAGEIKQHTP